MSHAIANPAPRFVAHPGVMALCLRLMLILFCLNLVAGHTAFAAPSPQDQAGADTTAAFARAIDGLPLRAVAIGGSITQAGEGWIGPWLRERFPQSPTSLYNAGMSGTGSRLGVYRIERDVIAQQPDLVLIEFVVNDSGSEDEEILRHLESMVVRLKRLPQPPAIVFVNVASTPNNRPQRHQRVADHYRLLRIDLQTPVENHLTQQGLTWSSLFSDPVHPNRAGHAFYAQQIIAALESLVPAPEAVPPASDKAPLPNPLSAQPLILDGTLAPLAVQPGWRGRERVGRWWDRFFHQYVETDQPGATYTLTFRGTHAGLLFPRDTQAFSNFYIGVDGQSFRLCSAQGHDGFMHVMAGSDLQPGWHVLHVGVPAHLPTDRRVVLGYALLAGGSTIPGSPAAPPAPGPWTAERLTRIDLKPVPASAWHWVGPFGGEKRTDQATADLTTPFPPELGEGLNAPDLQATFPGRHGPATWQAVQPPSDPDASGMEDSWVDLVDRTGLSDRGITYATTVLHRPEAGPVLLGLQVDYFAKLWINGRLVLTLDRGHGPPRDPVLIPLDLEAGDHRIVVKVHAGSAGNGFGLRLHAER